MSKVVRNTIMSDAEGTFYAAVDAAEVTRQNAMKGNPTDTQTRAANIAYHRAVVQAAGTQGHLGGPSRAALRDLTGSN